jgi:hypothetical protein
MNNHVKENKNHYLLAFLSLLIAREVFKEVKFGFLVVGHTHDDIDNCFGYLSKKLKEQNNYILANSMKAFMVSHSKVGAYTPCLHSKVDPRDSKF